MVDDRQGVPTEPVKITPGFIVFMSLMVLPAVVALAIYFGAWIVSSEVYAAEAASEPVATPAAEDFETAEDIAAWKRTLVAVCPLH